MKTFQLTPVNGRKSFNGKCHVNTFTNDSGQEVSELISFNTKIATYNHQNNKMIVLGWFSSTSANHINAFLDFYGFETCNKKELENYND